MLKDRMNRYMIERMRIPAADVPKLREKYFREYGTTLRGLQANYPMDVQDYLSFVHDVSLSDYLHPDPIQRAVLASLTTRNLIFTNADARHASRVLHILQLEEYFTDVVDVNRMDPYCKPSPEAFALAMKTAGEAEPSRCVLIDDLPHTTRAAKSMGMRALLYGAQSAGRDADGAFSDWRRLPALLNGNHP